MEGPKITDKKIRFNFEHKNVNWLKVVHIKRKRSRSWITHSPLEREPCYHCAAVQFENVPTGCASIGMRCWCFTLLQSSRLPFPLIYWMRVCVYARSGYFVSFEASFRVPLIFAIFLYFSLTKYPCGLYTIAAYKRFQCVSRQENWLIFADLWMQWTNMKWSIHVMLITMNWFALCKMAKTLSRRTMLSQKRCSWCRLVILVQMIRWFQWVAIILLLIEIGWVCRREGST